MGKFLTSSPLNGDKNSTHVTKLLWELTELTEIMHRKHWTYCLLLGKYLITDGLCYHHTPLTGLEESKGETRPWLSLPPPTLCVRITVPNTKASVRNQSKCQHHRILYFWNVLLQCDAQDPSVKVMLVYVRELSLEHRSSLPSGPVLSRAAATTTCGYWTPEMRLVWTEMCSEYAMQSKICRLSTKIVKYLINGFLRWLPVVMTIFWI